MDKDNPDPSDITWDPCNGTGYHLGQRANGIKVWDYCDCNPKSTKA